MEKKSLCHFIFELSVLKKLPRAGSFLAGIRFPDTVGEHVFRATQIAFFLAELEGGNGEHAAFLASIHDNGEARVGDFHKVAARYISSKEGEKIAFLEQCQHFPKKIREKYEQGFWELHEKKTTESIAAKDADLLELAFQAKEFLDQGFLGMKNWLENIEKMLKSQSAQEFFAEMQTMKSTDWWHGLKKITI